MENFELNVNLTECSFSIKGTEEFIDRKTKEIVELLTNYKRDIPKTFVQTKDMFTSNECNKVDTNLSSVNHYKKYEDAGIVSIDEDKVLILRQIPGKNNAAKMKNIALITLYVLDKSIESKSIVENCEKMSCYDSKNFSAIFKNDKSIVV